MDLAESADLPVPKTGFGVLGKVLWNDPGDICRFIPPVAVPRARVQLGGNEKDLNSWRFYPTDPSRKLPFQAQPLCVSGFPGGSLQRGFGTVPGPLGGGPPERAAILPWLW